MALAALAVLLQGCSGDPGPDRTGGPGRPTVVALGDSIPLNDPGYCPGCTGFVDGYADHLGGRAVNLARGGALTRTIAEQITGRAFADQLEDADVVLVSWGGNDQPPYRQGYQPCRVERPRTVREAVQDVADTTTECVDRVVNRLRAAVTSALPALREQAPDAELAVLAPYDLWLDRPELDAVPEDLRAAALRVTAYAVRTWRDTLCAVAAEQDVTCIDLATAFNGPDGDRPAGALLAADRSHPSQAGNDAILELLLDSGLAD